MANAPQPATLYDDALNQRPVGLNCENLAGFNAITANTTTNCLVLFMDQGCTGPSNREHGLVLPDPADTDLEEWRGWVASAQLSP
jgi:hypothetical protein